MSHPEDEQKIYQLYMTSYQNRSCSVCLQDVYLTFLDSTTNNTNNYSRAAKEPALVNKYTSIWHRPAGQPDIGPVSESELSLVKEELLILF